MAKKKKKARRKDRVGEVELLDRVALVDYTGAFCKKSEHGVSYHSNIAGLLSISKHKSGRKFFDTMHHEWFHQVFPGMRESIVRKLGSQFTELVFTKAFLKRAGLKKKKRR